MDRIVAFTGTGIFKTSGISTFKEMPGHRACLLRKISFYTSTAGYIVAYARFKGCEVEIINQNSETKVPEFLEKSIL